MKKNLNRKDNGMTLLLINEFGTVEYRKWFRTLEAAQAWLTTNFPYTLHRYTVEILYGSDC